MNLRKANFVVKNGMDIEKPMVKNMKIDTKRNREEDMKKMKSTEKGSRNKDDYLKIKLFSVLFVKSQ